jgi:hypothetical protein
MWYIIFKFRKYLNCETLEMFKYMHGTSYFLLLRKIFELKKIFRNGREKICNTSYLNLELNCETLEMFKYMHGTTFS